MQQHDCSQESVGIYSQQRLKLDLKYRPGTFDEVIGQDVTVTILRSVISSKRYNSAYMFSGPSGVGKTTLARIFAKAMLCDNPVEGNPCTVCDSCKRFSEEKHFEYIELDAASYGSKEEMVRLRDEAAFQSVGGRKIILIDECHDVSRQGQDALLKQVEQCPEHLTYLFCTTEPENVRRTLKKRCIQFQVSRVDVLKIFERLKYVCLNEKIPYDDEALRYLSDQSRGHVRDSLKTLEEVACLGVVSVENAKKVLVDYSSEISKLLCALCSDLPTSLQISSRLSTLVSTRQLYDTLTAMCSDAIKLLYGYDDFIPQYRSLLENVKGVHGYNLIEFLNYLISRDKFIDRAGLQSDIILLHHKFSTGAFKVQPSTISQSPVISVPTGQIPVEIERPISISPPPPTSPTITHAQLSKMSVKEKSAVLRGERKKVRVGEGQEEEQPKVPSEWSLPKEERQGTSSFGDTELSPLEFSRLLVGGRGSGNPNS